MSIDNNVKTNNYFEYRNIDTSLYENTKLPLWVKNEITDDKVNILDYGCGFGQNIGALLGEQYLNVYGIDIEKKAIEFCINKGYNIKEINLEDLHNPFDIKFDIVLMFHVLEHVPKDEVINTLSFIRNNLLSEKGKLLIAVPNAQSNTDCYWAYEDWTHTTLFTSGSLYYVLRAAGFNSIDFLDTDCTLGSTRTKKIIRRFLLKLYKINKTFWNKITCSAYHNPSPQIFSYEIKCKAY
tara:strand:+ start:1217 stop:1930 length:714 start_codon:yes stop_codon:yes gene_type:complete